MAEPISEERKRILLDMRSKAEEGFDKLIIYLNAGGLGVTVAFISDIIDVSQSQVRFILYACWLFYIIGLFFTLFSFRTAVKSVDLEIKGDIEKSDTYDKITHSLNSNAIYFFFAGTICFLLFIIINLK